MGFFEKDKLKFKRFDFFEERAFDQICTNVHKIIKHDFTFDSKERQDGNYYNFPIGANYMINTEMISYNYFNRQKKKWNERLSIYFYKYYLSNKKDLLNFSSSLLPNPTNDTTLTIRAHSKYAKFQYPISLVYISDDFVGYQSENSKLIKYEYDKQTDKIKIDTHVSKKCLKLIHKETIKILKNILDETK